MSYHMRDFEEGRIIVFTRNEEEAMGFLKECEKAGMLWADRRKPTDSMVWCYDPGVFAKINGIKYEKITSERWGLTYGYYFRETYRGCENVMFDDLIFGKLFEVRLRGKEQV